MHLAICAIFRNEAPYLREWIEFHRLVGVERFHLYQNRSEDDYQSVLRPYMAEGVVQLTEWPSLPPCQIQAYQHFLSRHAGQPWWVAFLDCDEFLFSPAHATVSEALDAVARPHWGAVGVNWMVFGASAQEAPAPGLVMERFTTRPRDDFPPNRHIKTIARMDRIASGGPNPHWFLVMGGTYGETGELLTGALTTSPSHRQLRINHYHTKSRQEYLKRIAGGRADGGGHRSPSEFDGYQAAEAEDREIWRFLPQLKQQMQAEPSEPTGRIAEARLPYALYAAPQNDHRELPRDFAGFHNYHEGETMLVCGCGSSLSAIISPEVFPAIGVNDVGRLFQPDYLVVVNPRSQFSGDRFRHVETSQARAIFTQLDLGVLHPNVVRIQLGKRGGTDLSDGRSLPYTRNSPYVALCLALHMGASRVGLIGVDFTEHHFFASTGRHPLAGEINQINHEYAALAEACRRRGVEVFNLSAESRLTTFPKISPEQFLRSSLVPADAAAAVRGKKVFFANYRFLSCGEVFSDGLRHAAEDLGMVAAAARWDESTLAQKVDEFAPDLLFVVHGRNYSQRWKNSLHHGRRSTVWLLDEPYEVDDTSRFSQLFDAVLLCDPGTLHRHNGASFLPVCYDPARHWYRPEAREHQVGFVGGGNPARERMLEELARRGLLSYAIGGPWRSAEVRRLSPSRNIPATETANLYRQTQIVLNVFRTAHHFNREKIPAVSMNPRIYEALACGCVVVSERRPEIQQLCPEIPVFDGPEEMIALIEELLADPARIAAVRRACIRRLAGHTYAHRLYTAFVAATEQRGAPEWIAAGFSAAAPQQPFNSAPPAVPPAQPISPALPAQIPAVPAGWEAEAGAVSADEDLLLLRAQRPAAPGSELGLIGMHRHANVDLSFDLETESNSTFVAKIHQLEQRKQLSNSYHLMVAGRSAYVARHNHVFRSFPLEENHWHTITMSYSSGQLTVCVDGRVECQVQDSLLRAGYCFLGVKAGTAKVRAIKVTAPVPETRAAVAGDEKGPQQLNGIPEFDMVYKAGPGAPQPAVSIITTVYDRVACLENCLRSVQALSFDSFEHIIIADAPAAPALALLGAAVRSIHDGRRRLVLASLRSRTNNWGMGPAGAGLSLAAGRYVCFLCDDNGYKPDHFGKLVAALDRDPHLGFVYSGCLYDGRVMLNSAPPSYGRIDLGQPLFRRELFERHFGRTLPFGELAWDWKMIQHFMRAGVRWKHIRDATFIFRLAKYPHLMAPVGDTQLTTVTA